MIGIDTNILVRYVTGDHPEQSRRAREVVDTQPIFVCLTVVLETEWVLRSVYGFAASEVARALRAFAGLPSVSVESPDVLSVALGRAEAGMDFADALHLGKAEVCEAFLTFDGKLAEKAAAFGLEKVRRA
jgi:predicted nucleic-acid-binding protein